MFLLYTIQMTRLLLVIAILTTSTYGQGLINIQSGNGVPTDMAIGGLLGAVLAPMISKGSDAKLVGGLLGATAGGMYGTANNQIKQQQQYNQEMEMRQYINQQQIQIAALQKQMATMNTSSGGNDYSNIPLGIIEGKFVRSPFSKFRVEPKSMNLDSGDVLYDPFNGKPFKLP